MKKLLIALLLGTTLLCGCSKGEEEKIAIIKNPNQYEEIENEEYYRVYVKVEDGYYVNNFIYVSTYADGFEATRWEDDSVVILLIEKGANGDIIRGGVQADIPKETKALFIELYRISEEIGASTIITPKEEFYRLKKELNDLDISDCGFKDFQCYFNDAKDHYLEFLDSKILENEKFEEYVCGDWNVSQLEIYLR